MYLGDGTITRHPTSFGLHVYLDTAYPGVIEECAGAMASVLRTRIGRYPRENSACLQLTSYSQFWPDVFPQHGSGKKHEREIKLVNWQAAIIKTHPKLFIRGSIHSDGSRCLNTFSVDLKDGPKQYSYPRYFFTNYSADIRKIFCDTCDTCDLVGIRWSRSNWRNISISHRKSVALLDSCVGPKS
ncbi:MAG: helix-turn-helix domain-containing protein [Thermoleophilia bacterium]|nr:helix-turn-helix domain-containing protein [Thermoleophilia bacterium]